MKNKILILRMKNASFNMGEQAILSGILHDLSKLSSFQLEILENPTKSLRQKSGAKAAHSYLPITVRVLQAISKTDLLIWGGGHMLQDQSSALDIPYHLTNLFFAHALHIPIILYGVEIGPIDTKIGAFFSSKALRKVDLILVRNQRSESILRKIGVNKSNVYITADPAFLVSPDKGIVQLIRNQHNIPEDLPLVGIAPRKAFHKVSGLMPATLRRKLNMMPPGFHENFTRFKQQFAKICDCLASDFYAHLLFMPMDISANCRDDLVCRDIMSLMARKDNAHYLEPGLNPADVAGLIQAMDLVISQRLHTLILACSMGTPMIGIASTGNKDKCAVFLKDIGQASRCVDVSLLIEPSQTGSLLDLVRDTWANRPKINRHLRSMAMHQKAKSSMNIEYLRSWLNRRKLLRAL